MSSGDRVVMPQLGESIVEATLVKWRVAEGEQVEKGQILAEVETDKASNDIPSPASGKVGALLVKEGQTVDVGTEILRFASAATGPKTEPKTKPENERLPTRHLTPRPLGPGGPTRSSPAVRRLARRFQVDINALKGSGKGGRVTRDDLLAAVKTRSTSAPTARAKPSFTPPGYSAKTGDQVQPFSRRRKLIAKHLLHSLGTAAHVATVAEIDVRTLVAARARDKTKASAAGLNLTFLPYVVHATVRALTEFPQLNATVQNEALILKAAKNIGIAVDAPEGLVVPVLHGADELGLLGLAKAIERLSAKARASALTADDISGGSFTISNPGKDGNLFGISIIRQPEVGILRIGQIVKRPVVRTIDGEDAIVIRPIMYAALSYDHRVIDGRTGNGFLNRICALLGGLQPAL